MNNVSARSAEQHIEADYVVVGGGTAGSVIASRLSENPDVRVVLLEAGPATGPSAMAVPAAWPTLLGTEVDWAFTSTPQAGLEVKTVPYPRGRVLGGSSAINAMAHVRGHRSGYDRWVTEGAAGWGYDDLLPYFQRSESALRGDRRYRGTSGPMQVAVPPETQPFALVAWEAVRECGYLLSDDLNGPEQEGAAFAEMNIVDGRRQSAADAYLRPVLDTRTNLTVITGASVHRLILSDGRCEGAEYTLDGARRRVLASAETVLCGGVFGSPHVLMCPGSARRTSCGSTPSPRPRNCRTSARTCRIIPCARSSTPPRRPFRCCRTRAPWSLPCAVTGAWMPRTSN